MKKQLVRTPMLPFLKRIYGCLPSFLTVGLKYVPDGLLFGTSYRACTPSTDCNIIGHNVKMALDYAYKHTAWGRENIPEVINESDATELLKTLPVVSSEELAANPDRFISDEATDLNSYWTTTGGSGRNPTSIRLSNASYGIEWKHVHAIWGEEYSRRNDLKLTFRGYHLDEGTLIRFDPIYNELSVDPFQLNDGNFDKFLKNVRTYNVSCVHGYPSLIALFMERLKSSGDKFLVKSIFLGSEGASVELKKQLADFFKASVIAWYGLSEKVVLAYDPDSSGRFINFSSYGYPWILNPDENGIGEIIGTTFVNKAMPLVNYRTGDYGKVLTQRRRGTDGVERDVLMIEKLSGRTGKDFIFGKNGEKFTMTAVNLHGEVQKKIVFYQIVQKEYGKIEVKVLPKNGCGDDVIVEMQKELRSRLKGFNISCQKVQSDADFVKSDRGKMIMLVQEL